MRNKLLKNVLILEPTQEKSIFDFKFEQEEKESWK